MVSIIRAPSLSLTLQATQSRTAFGCCMPAMVVLACHACCGSLCCGVTFCENTELDGLAIDLVHLAASSST